MFLQEHLNLPTHICQLLTINWEAALQATTSHWSTVPILIFTGRQQSSFWTVYHGTLLQNGPLDVSSHRISSSKAYHLDKCKSFLHTGRNRTGFRTSTRCQMCKLFHDKCNAVWQTFYQIKNCTFLRNIFGKKNMIRCSKKGNACAGSQ